ncbi:MAG TPA: biotin carboxylase N-terminal domain-containing protein, partial [Phenylobacterium sp.]
MHTVLIANRGEIAIRIARAVADAGLQSIAIYSEDDANSLHVQKADRAVALEGRGARAYLDIEQIVALAKQSGADGVHPGYGFLSENAAFARAVEAAGLTFIGPSPETLDAFGDKVKARALAESCGAPLLKGAGPVDAETARAFLAGLPAGRAMIIKAVSGGGGRGMRLVREVASVAEAFERASSEAVSAFGNPALYVEEFLPNARHVEVQIIGDGEAVSHLWERECSLQRRHQKVVEIAPSPSLKPEVRQRILDAAVLIGRAAAYRGLGTMEFLVADDGESFCFMEGNARLQVEHTVTEEVLGLDLVQAQLAVAQGQTLQALGLTQDKIPACRGFAIQARVNLESYAPDGSVRPGGGQLTAFAPPSGPGVRTDTYGYAGYRTNPAFDSLIAKVICHSPSPHFGDAVRRLRRALGDMTLAGAPSNLDYLLALLADERVVANAVDTRFLDDNAEALVRAAQAVSAARREQALPGHEAAADVTAGSDAHQQATTDADGATPFGAPL